MSGFYDARCPRCGARVGWAGRLEDWPDCHRCGAKPDRESLRRDAEAIERTRAKLAERIRADAELPCRHLTVDENLTELLSGDVSLRRRCLLCGVSYDRTSVLERLRADIRERNRLPTLNEIREREE